MADFKVGDIVMIIKPTPCCNHYISIGEVFTITGFVPPTWCGVCMNPRNHEAVEGHPSGRQVSVQRIKKIDPPSEGDSLPTRADLKLEA